MDTLTLPMYRGKRGTGTFSRFSDRNELVSYCDSHSHVWFITLSGDARECKINGKVRTWKRDHNRIGIPLKYGMYEYWTVDLREGLDRLLKTV